MRRTRLLPWSRKSPPDGASTTRRRRRPRRRRYPSETATCLRPAVELVGVRGVAVPVDAEVAVSAEHEAEVGRAVDVAERVTKRLAVMRRERVGRGERRLLHRRKGAVDEGEIRPRERQVTDRTERRGEVDLEGWRAATVARAADGAVAVGDVEARRDGRGLGLRVGEAEAAGDLFGVRRLRDAHDAVLMVDFDLEAEVVIAAALGREPCLEHGSDLADEASLAEHERVVDVEQNEDNEASGTLKRNTHEEAAVERRACEAKVADQEHEDQVVPDRARVLVAVKVLPHAANVVTRVPLCL